MAEGNLPISEAPTSTSGSTGGHNLGFRWTTGLRQSLDPRSHLASSTPRRIQEDLHQVIRGLGPLMEQSQNMSLGSWLRQAPQSQNNNHNSVSGHHHHHHHHHHNHGSYQMPNRTINTNISDHEHLVSANITPLSSPSGEHDFVINVDSDDVSPGSGRTVPRNGQAGGGQDNTNGPEASQGGVQSELLRQSPELRMAVSVLEKLIPFLLILLIKLIYDHKIGILVLLGLIITFTHANCVIKREVAKQGKRNIGSLWAITVNLITCIFFIYYALEPKHLYYSLVFLQPFSEQSEHPPSFWNLLWVVAVTDFILKLITILCKVVILALPPNVIPFQKKGKYYLFIEQSSQLYRNFAPLHPWLIYFIEAYNGYEKIAGIIMVAGYIVAKMKQTIGHIRTWKAALTKLMQSVSYGSVPSTEQLDATGNVCPICQDNLKLPTLLQCKHIFCEECVSMWFDRERTCPMCRAQIADDPAWRDGATTHFIQIF